jgi:TPR repeat protein
VQLSFKASFILLSSFIVGGTYLYAAPSQEKLASCLIEGSKVVSSVDGAASHTLGENYESGAGVPQDSEQAFLWYCNAAMQHYPDSQLKVALLLLEGKGVEKDISKGMKWLNIAANNGSHDAELSLGILLVDSDPMRSAILFKRAAAAGNLYANHRLAELYYYGIGVPQDYAKAQELSELGVAAGFSKSRDLLTRIRVKQVSGEFKSREPVPQAETIVQIQAAPQEQEKEEKSNSILKRLMAMLPSLSSDKEPHAPSNVEVATSNARVISDEPDISKVSDNHSVGAQDTATAFAASNIEPALTVTDTANEPIKADDNTLFDGGVSSVISQDYTEEPASTDIANQQALEDQLVQAAQEESQLEPAVETDRSAQSSFNSVEERASSERSLETNTSSSLANKETTSDFNAVSRPIQRDALLRGASWINQQPEMRYSIQLVQASQVDGILKYIQTHNLDDKAYYIHALQDGQYRYILLYGDYPNNKTSKAVAKTLPEAVQKAGYWIRTYGDLRRSYVISP